MWEVLLSGSIVASLVDIWFFFSLLINTKRRFVHILLLIYSLSHLVGLVGLNLIYSEIDYSCIASIVMTKGVFPAQLLITSVIAANVTLASFRIFSSYARRNIQRFGYVVILAVPSIICAFFIGKGSCDAYINYVYSIPFFILTGINFILLIVAIIQVQVSGKINAGDKKSHYTFYALLSVNMGIYRLPAVVALYLQGISAAVYFFYISEGAVIAIVCSYHYKLWRRKAPDQVPNDAINSMSMSTYSENSTFDSEKSVSPPNIPREAPLAKSRSSP